MVFCVCSDNSKANCSRLLWKITVLINFSKSSVSEPYFFLASLACNFTKIRLGHRCFSVNLMNFFRKTFLFTVIPQNFHTMKLGEITVFYALFYAVSGSMLVDHEVDCVEENRNTRARIILLIIFMHNLCNIIFMHYFYA